MPCKGTPKLGINQRKSDNSLAFQFKLLPLQLQLLFRVKPMEVRLAALNWERRSMKWIG